jgi:hypothetical protein
MRRTRKHRTATVAVALAAVFLFASLVSPAVGGPSLGSVAKTAKKALRTAKKANSRAKRALRRSGPPGIVSLGQEEVPAAPQDFARFDIRCPGGTRAVGIGMGLGALEPVFFASYGTGALGSAFNPSSTTVFSGDMYVECVEGFAARASSTRQVTRKQALRELRRREKEALATR